jgi:hypothetical protein
MQVRRGTASSWTSTNPTLAAGELGFETDTGKFKIGTGSSTWTGLAYATGLNAITYLYNATAAQTTFSGADANGLTLAYTVGTEQVFLNGALQVRGSDYTATNGTSIVLTSGALASDVLNVIAYGATTITDTYTQAQADAKFFQNANAFVAGKNKIINGDFGVWQRGTSYTLTAISTYGAADRFRYWHNGSTVGTNTVSQETFTPGSAPVAGYESQFFQRATTTTLGTGQTVFDSWQRIENVRTFAGQAITFSVWAKSSGSRNLTLEVAQNFGSGGSTQVTTTILSSAATTTGWVRYSGTITMPSVSGKTIGTNSYLNMAIRFSGVVAGDTFDIWGVQLEAGSIATPFQTATGTLQGELAACQRYYQRLQINGVSSLFGSGFCDSTTSALIKFPFAVPMRVAPTALEQSGTATDYATRTAGSTNTICNLVPSHFGATTYEAAVNFGVALGLVAGQGAFGRSNATTAYLGWSAEL